MALISTWHTQPHKLPTTATAYQASIINTQTSQTIQTITQIVSPTGIVKQETHLTYTETSTALTQTQCITIRLIVIIIQILFRTRILIHIKLVTVLHFTHKVTNKTLAFTRNHLRQVQHHPHLHLI